MAKRRPDDERTAALFMYGRSQAVRLPKEFRFEGDRVRIRREGEKVILEPIAKRGWPPGFWERFDELPPISDAFATAVREELPESPDRDRAIDAYVRWANEQPANEQPASRRRKKRVAKEGAARRPGRSKP